MVAALCRRTCDPMGKHRTQYHPQQKIDSTGNAPEAASGDIDRRPPSLSIRPELPCGPKAEALDCGALHCPAWISAAGPVLTFRLTSGQKSEARTS
jgi:hypothetical protein